MLLASDINECIFSYLFAEDLCNCFATCKLWYASKDSKSTSVLIWFNLYRNLVESPKLSPHIDDFPWYRKFIEIYSFVSGANPFTLTDARPEVLKCPKVSAGSRLVCRSGHTASLFYVDNREVIVFFGGATHFYTFVNSYDILSVDDGVPIRTYAVMKGDVPTARWLHRACSYEKNTKAIIFGGQINDGAFSNDVYMFTLAQSASPSPVAEGGPSHGFDPSLHLESVLVPSVDGNKSNGPEARGGHSFVYDMKRNRFIVFGGLTAGNEVEICVNDTYELTVENEVMFTLNEAVSPGRLGYDYRSKRGPDSGLGVGIRGSSSGSCSASGPMAVWRKLHCTGALPSPRWCHSSVLQGEDMIVFGGWSYERTVGSGSGSKFFNDIHILDISTLVWTQVHTRGSPPRPRCQCACFHYDIKADALSIMKDNKWKDKAEDSASSGASKLRKNKDERKVDSSSMSRDAIEMKSRRDTLLTDDSLLSAVPSNAGVTASPMQGLGQGQDIESSLSFESHNDADCSYRCALNDTIEILGQELGQSKAPARAMFKPGQDRPLFMGDPDPDRLREGVTAGAPGGRSKGRGGCISSTENSTSASQMGTVSMKSWVGVGDSEDHAGGGGLWQKHSIGCDNIRFDIESDSSRNVTVLQQDRWVKGRADIGTGVGAGAISNLRNDMGWTKSTQSHSEERDWGGASNSESSSAGKNRTTADDRRSLREGEEEGEGEGLDFEGLTFSSSRVSGTAASVTAIGAGPGPGLEPRGSKEPVSKGFMIVYGGSCHNQEVESANVAYGSLVVDFHDFKVLDLDCMLWLPVACSYPRCRGGIHAIVQTSRGWLLSGGMQTEGISDMPRFKNDTTFIQPNIGSGRSPQTWSQGQSQSQRGSRSKHSDKISEEEIRVKSKFLTVKA